jgi:hypothetical protein
VCVCVCARASACCGQLGLGGLDQVVRDPGALDLNATGVPHGVDERRRPKVLPDEQGGRRVPFELGRGVFDVFLADQPANLAVERIEQGDVSVILELHGANVSFGILRDEHEIQDADRAALDELAELRSDLAVELVAGEPDNDLLDQAERHLNASVFGV